MRWLLENVIARYLGKQLDFRVRLFNVLAMTGIAVSLVSTVSCIIGGERIASTLFNLSTSFVAYGLMRYASRTGKYQLCYMITIIAIFIALFTFIFFTGGGYHGAMPYYFIFSVVFTVYMLEGKKAVIMAAVELAYYTGLCFLAYFHPELISVGTSPAYQLIEVLFGFLPVSILLSFTMGQQFRMYNEQQRALEAARAEAELLSRAKSSFLASMSHEIRTPINVILGMNEMILREGDSQKVSGYARNIQNAGNTLLLLINNVLDVSKIESGKIEIVRQSYALADMIDELCVTGSQLAERHGLYFHADIAPDLPRALYGDCIHVKQVAINFLGNAAKYTKQGGVTLSVSRRACERDGEMLLYISVADTGVGIKEEDIDRLFEAFSRAEHDQSAEGTGLGLAIAKELVELMGGRIGVQSTWGEGSVFYAELPQGIADERPLAQAGDCAPASIGARFVAPGARILAVDDNPDNLMVLRSLLSHTLMRVDTAGSGQECVRAAGEADYHAILLDYMMPHMDGLDTLAALRASGCRAPVVALTANVVAGVREKLLGAGFCRYLSKPILWKELEATLIELLPEDLVTLRAGAARQEYITAAQAEESAKELLFYGVCQQDALHFLGGDMRQYGAIATFFVDSARADLSECAALVQRRDWPSLRFLAHSLKSRARAVGANSLADTAAKLEELCGAQDGEYIEAVWPVLRYEWERAARALRSFVDRLERLAPQQESPPAQIAGLDELYRLLRHNRQADARADLQRRIAAADSPRSKERFAQMLGLVNAVEFGKARELLGDWMKGEAHG